MSVLTATVLSTIGWVPAPVVVKQTYGVLTTLSPAKLTVTLDGSTARAQQIVTPTPVTDVTFEFEPAYVFIDNKLITSYTKLGSCCKFSVPVSGVITALSSDCPKLSGGTAVLSVDALGAAFIVLSPGADLSLASDVITADTETQVTLLPNDGLGGASAHVLTVLKGSFEDSSSLRLVTVNGTLDLVTDWGTIATEKGFELYAE